jgi:DNA-binding protein HU-beta
MFDGGRLGLSKNELVQRIADEAKGPKSEAQRFFDAFEEVVTDALKKDEQVQITGFGKIYVHKREAREGVNPQTKVKMKIPASKAPKLSLEEKEEREALLNALVELVVEEPLPELVRMRDALDHLPSLAEERNSRDALLAARARNTMRVLEDRARLREECVPAKSVAGGLGVSRQRLHQLRRQGRLLAVLPRGRRESLYPAWQFTEEGEIVEGLERVIRAAREADIDEETLHFFMVEPNDRLEGEPPADLLARGEVDRVVEVLNSAGLGPF